MAIDYLGFRMTEIEELIGKGASQITMNLVPVEKAAPYAAADAVAVLLLAEKLSPEIREKKLERLFFETEMPLLKILAEMEYTGIKVDVQYLRKLEDEFAALQKKLEAEIFSLAGQEFNPNSTKQLGVILFEKLQLPVIRRTKTGYCTDEEVLRQLSLQHELPQKLIDYRELQKLKSTYIDALLSMNDPDTQRVHTSFNQTVTATGRLSSSAPNLQNIPVRSDYGKMIREAFVPDEGHVFLSADYSQIDLRVLAHVSNDEALVSAFSKGGDIHAATAREVFNIAIGEEVPLDRRRMAKSINFGIVYGISPYGLAQQLKISNEEAKIYIQSYFAKYRGVEEWIRTVLKEARTNGYVTTLLGRIRYLPDINSSNGQVRSFAERMAMNTPIQGTSADIIKVAMITLAGKLQEKAFKTKMLVQVHDELLFEVPENELQSVSGIIKDEMENAMKLTVPVIVDLKAGRNWAEMKALR
jgi:DNA polymerase-1